MRDLPPLNWIRAFEAAARHESFLRAGEELGVSGGAISQRVKLLETRLKTSLFERHSRGVRLTDSGRQYCGELTSALDRIAAATAQIAAAAPRLNIAALPAMAEKWLTPRLPKFNEQYPDVAVEVSVAETLNGLGSRSFDLGLHYATEEAAGFSVATLFRDRMFPACSPAYAEEHDLREARDLLRCRLLYDTRWAADWSIWFEAAGLPADSGRRDAGFALYSMAVEAAIEDLGVVMGHAALVGREIDSARLVAPFGLTVEAPHSYAVFIPADRGPQPQLEDFVRWLRDEAAFGQDP